LPNVPSFMQSFSRHLVTVVAVAATPAAAATPLPLPSPPPPVFYRTVLRR
jgi:hypothetical protein